MEEQPVDVAIVGAGVAGLAAGRDLIRRGWKVQILDKGRGVGGRMATRRFDGAVFDTGAQFFSAREAPFREFLEEDLLHGGSATEWYRRGSDGYYRGVPAMTGPAKQLAAELSVATSHRVTGLATSPGGWRLTYDKSGEEGELFSRGVLLTPPVPQTITLLEPAMRSMDQERVDLLSTITYDPSLVLLLRLEGDSPIAPPGYDRPRDDSVLYWVADNRRKGVSPEEAGPAITVHAKPTFSRELYDAPEEDITKALLERFLERYPPGGRYEVAAMQVKKWRYARPHQPTPERTYLISGAGAAPAVVAGDAFGGPRVEGAYLSGIAAAELLSECLKSSRTVV